MPKSTQTRVVGKVIDKVYPSDPTQSQKCGVGCTLSITFPTTLVCVLFGTTIPTYFYNFQLFFILVHNSSRTQDTLGCPRY